MTESGEGFREVKGTKTLSKDLFLQDLCSYVCDMLEMQQLNPKQKTRKSVCRFIAFLYDSNERPVHTKFYKDIGVYTVVDNKTSLPQGTHCLPVPDSILQELKNLSDKEFRACVNDALGSQLLIKNGVDRQAEIFWSLRQARRLAITHLFQRSSTNAVSLPGLAVDFTMTPLYLTIN